MGLLQHIRSTGCYERRVLITLILVGTSTNWTAMGILVLIPDVNFGYNAKNLTSDCDLKENSTLSFDRSQFDYTATEKYSLICEREWLRNMAKTISILGYVVGAFGSGVLSDRYGRRLVLLTASLLSIIENISSIFMPNIQFYLFGRFVHGVLCITVQTTAIVSSTEALLTETRYLAALFVSMTFEFSKILIGATSYFIKDFRHHHICNACQFALVFFIVYFFTFESARWLAAKNQRTKVDEIIKNIAKINNEDREIYSYMKTVVRNQERQSSFLDIVRTPLIRKRTLILFVFWTSTMFATYAIILNFNSFTNDIRLGLIMMGTIGIPANFPILYSTNIIGRQVCMFVLLAVSVVLLFAMVPFAHDKASPVLMTLAAVGSVTVGGVFAIIYMFTQELYPTVIRQTGLGACSTVSRIAALLAPQISLLNAYWPPATAVILGSVVALALLLVPALPDTTGEELAQTIDEGEQFLKHHRYSLGVPKRRPKPITELPVTEEITKLNDQGTLEI